MIQVQSLACLLSACVIYFPRKYIILEISSVKVSECFAFLLTVSTCNKSFVHTNHSHTIAATQTLISASLLSCLQNGIHHTYKKGMNCPNAQCWQTSWGNHQGTWYSPSYSLLSPQPLPQNQWLLLYQGHVRSSHKATWSRCPFGSKNIGKMLGKHSCQAEAAVSLTCQRANNLLWTQRV